MICGQQFAEWFRPVWELDLFDDRVMSQLNGFVTGITE
jgi:hypothetical protein